MGQSPNCVIVGAGSLGQSFAALLAQAGHEVTLLATPRSSQRLSTNGGIRLQGAVDAVVPLRTGSAIGGSLAVTTDAAEMPPDAQVIFTTQGHDLPPAIQNGRSRPGARPAWAPGDP